jgi:hypothetical protein
MLQELSYRRPSVIKATDWQTQLATSVHISSSIPAAAVAAAAVAAAAVTTEEVPSANTNGTGNGGIVGNGNGVNNGDTNEGPVVVYDDGGIAAARVGLGAVLVLGGIYAARKLMGK